MRLLARQAQEEVDIYYSDEARNYFGSDGSPVDLAQLDTLRGRDHQLPKYNEARVILNLPPATTWSDISSNTTIQQTLQRLYATVDDVEMTIGALCEDHDLRPSSSMGPLFRAGMMAQFIAIRDSDRFWYQAPGVLDSDAFQAVQETNLRTLFLRHFKDNSTLPASIWKFAADGEAMPAVSSGVQFTPNYKVSWALSSQNIEFELSFTGTVGWLGMGLSPNPNMVRKLSKNAMLERCMGPTNITSCVCFVRASNRTNRMVPSSLLCSTTRRIRTPWCWTSTHRMAMQSHRRSRAICRPMWQCLPTADRLQSGSSAHWAPRTTSKSATATSTVTYVFVCE